MVSNSQLLHRHSFQDCLPPWVLPSFCTPIRIRTETCTGLKPDVSASWTTGALYPLSDSNRKHIVPKTIASASWAKWAKKKPHEVNQEAF